MQPLHALLIIGFTMPALLASFATRADDTVTTDTSERISTLESELALLKRQYEVDKEITQGNTDKFATTELGAKGLLITSPDKNMTFGIRGYTQLDSRWFLGDEENVSSDSFYGRRIRLSIEGTLFKDFAYRIMPDFAGGSSTIFDAYLDYRFSDAVKVRAGKFKPPVGLERLQSATDTFFIERGLPTNFVPTRDYGIQLFGEPIPETIEYQIGIFNGVADLANGNSDEDNKKDVAARLFAHPFRRSDSLLLQGLGIGIGGSIGDRDGSPLRSNLKTILPQYRSVGQNTIFSYRSGSSSQDDATFAASTTYANGDQIRIAPQAYWYYNNFGVLTEFSRTSQDVTRGTDSATLDHDAWQVSAGWMITGEDLNFKGGVKPARRFSPFDGGWGAVELVARYNQIKFDDASFPLYSDITRSVKRGDTAGVGVNWYLNENVQLWLNYDFTRFDGGSATGDREDEQALFTRVQFRL